MEESGEGQTRPKYDKGGRRKLEEAGERRRRLDKDGGGREGWIKPKSGRGWRRK